MVRQAHHERNIKISITYTVRPEHACPELVEGSKGFVTFYDTIMVEPFKKSCAILRGKRKNGVSFGCVCLFVLLFFVFPQSASALKTVQSTGIGVILQKDVNAARDQALKKAFSGAVEETVAGLFYFSTLSRYNDALKEILSHDPMEYIDRYRILFDRREDNLYKVEVEAGVSEEKIKRKLAEVGLIRYEGKTLALALFIQTRIDQGVPNRLMGNKEDFTRFAAQQYRTRGFEIIRDPVASEESPNSFEKLRVNNRLTALQGRRLSADAVVLGLVEIRTAKESEMPAFEEDFSVKIWVRAIRSSDAALLGIREGELMIKRTASPFMVRQLIRQKLDALLNLLGEDIRKNIQ
ncbi:MAG: hypothetical protein GXP58_05700 [Deltaproteobacteria bacterium]|nr:hypothetical protein [Deltaproteobacteria bacterium]